MNPDPLGPPIAVRPLLKPERSALLELLASLDADDWKAPTPCPGWSVHDLAVHLVHDDLRRLSADCDRHLGARVAASSFEELAVALDAANQGWVAAVVPTLSPRLTTAMLAWLAEPSQAHLSGLAPQRMGATVSWAGPGPHPNWLDVAREFTERWVHQQQIRQSVGHSGCDEPVYLDAVVDTFVRAAPTALPPRAVGTQVEIRVTAPVERRWSLESGTQGWGFVSLSPGAAAVVQIPPAVLWQRAVRMLSREEASAKACVDGDSELVAAVLDLRAAIVQDREQE